MNIPGIGSQINAEAPTVLDPKSVTATTVTPGTTMTAATVEISQEAYQAHAAAQKHSDEHPVSGALPVVGLLPFRTAGGPNHGSKTPRY